MGTATTTHDGDFANRATFAGADRAQLDDLSGVDVAIVGAPFDWGTTNRPGARYGPAAIRSGDYFGAHASRPHLPTAIDPFAELRIVDVGDFELPLGYMEESVAQIRDGITRIASQGVVPLVLGGDHTITFPNAGGVADVHGHGEFALVHFDAHADTGDTQHGQLLGHATPMRRLIESGAVPGHRFVQIGLRGYWPPPDIVEWMREQEMRTYMMTEILERGLTPVVDEALEYALSGVSKAFISVDIDVVDPGMAPGTGTPEPGGLTSRELLHTLRRLARELNVIGADVVEVSPPYDGPGDITSILANRVVLEILNGMAERKVAAA
ncbi:MAG: agmatinase [Acidimicrobiia bacterium]|nr:agmatinase [Acidimicrobiia bacterium]